MMQIEGCSTAVYYEHHDISLPGIRYNSSSVFLPCCLSQALNLLVLPSLMQSELDPSSSQLSLLILKSIVWSSIHQQALIRYSIEFVYDIWVFGS
jgi:hypothetical protein